jgi:outer membrane receptor protein involved in Fe transport
MRYAVMALAAPVMAWGAHAAEKPPTAGDADALDRLSDIPFEQLVQTEVETSSRIARQVSDALSAVTIVTAEEIKAYGFRTLADVINSMRGQYTTYDRLYQYMGGRGFGVPGDFAGRSLVLIDGYAAPDNVYNQNYIDNAGLVDLDLIERVEYVPGSGSVIYGNNALLSLINIVTKKGSAFRRAQVSGELASYGGQRWQATWGDRLDSGADVLLSASRQRSAGQTIYMPGFDSPAFNRGLAVNQDFESSQRFMGKFELEGLSLQAAYVSRTKGRPTATDGWISYDFNTDQRSTDKNAFVSAKYEMVLSDSLRSSSHLYLGDYRFLGFGPIDGNFTRDVEDGTWWGLDQKFTWTNWGGHTPVFGAEFRDDRQRSRIDLIEDQSASKRTVSLYAQDVYDWMPQWKLYGGARWDQVLGGERTFSPRAGLIYQASPAWVFKSSAGAANRQPTYFEKYSRATFKLPNLDLRPEKVVSVDLLVQYDWSKTTKLAGTVYRYAMRERIAFSPESTRYENVGPSASRGLELELDYRGVNGVLLKASGAFQEARDFTGQPLLNAPNAVVKLNFSHLVANWPWRAGYEFQYIGPRLTLAERRIGGFSVANLTLNSARKWAGFAVGLGVKNASNRRIDAVSPVIWPSPEQPTQDTLRMDGTNYWLKVTYDLGW